MDIYKDIPKLYSQENSKDPTVYLIITCLNSFWLITEYDPKQKLGFGYCQLLQDCGELGYVSIQEIEDLPYPVDYTPIELPLSKLKKIFDTI